MTILTPILIWLAKFLIQYFLQTHLELSRELEASLKRNEEHEVELKKLEDASNSIVTAIQLEKMQVEHLNRELADLDFMVNQLEEKYKAKQEEYNKNLDKLTDGELVRSTL